MSDGPPANGSLGTANSPLGAANSPLGAANSPLGAANSPLGAANSPLGAANSPLGAANSPLGAANSPLGANIPVGAANSPPEEAHHRAPIGQVLSVINLCIFDRFSRVQVVIYSCNFVVFLYEWRCSFSAVASAC